MRRPTIFAQGILFTIKEPAGRDIFPADPVTQRRGGDRAVAEASLHLLDKFFGGYDPLKPLQTGVSYSGKWGV